MSRRLRNALVGGAVTVLTVGLAPLAPALGGAVSGYLEAADDRVTSEDGVRVGALGGVLAFVATTLVVVVAGNVLLALAAGLFGVPFAAAGAGGLLLVVVGVAAAAYTVGLSAAGGWLGVYARREL